MTSTAFQDEATISTRAPAQVVASRREQILDLTAMAVSVLLFLGLCLYQLELPGLYPDEAFDVIPTMQLVLGREVELWNNAGLHLFGLDLPLMSSSDYQGVTSTYLALPFFLLGGVNVYSLRLTTVTVGVVAHVLAFFLARSWFGPSQARLAVLLFAVSPAWVFWSRLGVYVVSPVVPIASGALLAFTAWTRTRPFGARNFPLYTGTFLLGLGLATKLLFLWYIVALLICAFFLYGRRLWDGRGEWLHHKARWLRTALLALGWFCVGAFPFLLYNLMTRGTFYVLRQNLTTTGHGVDNTAFVRNLWTEADAFKVLLDGGYFWFQGVNGRVYANPLTPAIFALSAIGLLGLVVADRFDRGVAASHRIRLPVVLLAMAVAISSLLTFLSFDTAILNGLLLSAIALGTVGTVWLALTAVRNGDLVPHVSSLLLVGGTVCGALWWFGGAGRPETASPEGVLGLWPVDSAGVLFWLFGAALLFTLGFDLRLSRFGRTVVVLLGLTGLVVAQSTVTVSGLWSTHLLILLPLPQITIAAFVLAAAHRLTRTRVLAMRRKPTIAPFVRLAATLVVAALIALDLAVDYSYHRDLSLTGGGSTFSDAIYSLASYLDSQNPKSQVVAMDWGFRRPLQLLNHERVDPVEPFWSEPDERKRALRELLADPGTLYLFHTPEGSRYRLHDEFKAEAEAAGKVVRLERTFYHRDGNPVYEVYSAR